jgi:PEP-CTERM motif
MKHPRSVWCIAAAAVIAGAGHVSAQTTITFDNLLIANGDAFSSYSEGGFDVSLLSGYICGAQVFGNPVPDLYGGGVCNPSTTESVLDIKLTGGGLFTFLGTDLATQNGTSTYLFTGLLSTVSQFSSGSDFTLSGTFADFANPSSATLIDELQIMLNTSTASSYNIDNIQLAPTEVPEPGTLSFLALGLAGLATGGRRRWLRKRA